jgi:hypothetical protein
VATELDRKGKNKATVCEDSIMKPTKHCLQKRGRRKRKMGI